MPASEGRGTRRVRYRQGQLLASRDLQQDSAYESYMRRLHLCALHGSWGVVPWQGPDGNVGGFPLRLSDDRRQLMVGPGLAYDGKGREILLAETLALEGPRQPLERTGRSLPFDLVVSFRDPLHRRDRGELCLAEDLDPSEERPVFRWVPAEESAPGAPLKPSPGLRLGLDIPLGRFERSATGQLSGPDLRV